MTQDSPGLQKLTSNQSWYILPSQGYINELVDQNFTNYLDTVSREPILFGDYRNALTEDPRLYEDVVDYEAAKAIFDEVGDEFLLVNFLLVERSHTFHFNQ